MIYKPNILPFADLTLLLLNLVIYYFVNRMEQLNCVDIEKSWRHNFLKLYTVLNIIITVLSMLVEVTKNSLILYTLIRLPLHLFLVYVVYTYTYELKCNLKGSDIFVYDFLKFYAMIRILIVLMVIVMILSVFFSFMPRYRSIMSLIEKK